MEALGIGQLAKRGGVGIDTVRFRPVAIKLYRPMNPIPIRAMR
jgi:hypothetical protein